MQRKMTAGVLAVLALLALWPTLGVGEEGEPSRRIAYLALSWGWLCPGVAAETATIVPSSSRSS